MFKLQYILYRNLTENSELKTLLPLITAHQLC